MTKDYSPDDHTDLFAYMIPEVWALVLKWNGENAPISNVLTSLMCAYSEYVKKAIPDPKERKVLIKILIKHLPTLLDIDNLTES